MSENCLFCGIAAGKIPATTVYQDDRVLAFEDVNPQAPFHVLIIPRRHIATLNDLKPDDEILVGEIVKHAARLAKDYGHDEDGYRTVFNCNRGAGQSVFHIHLHLLAGRNMTWPPG